MPTHKWSNYISRDSPKPALPWLTSLKTNVSLLFMRSHALDAVTGRGKSLSWELLFQAKVEKGIAFTPGPVDIVHCSAPYLWAANPLTQGPAKGACAAACQGLGLFSPRGFISELRWQNAHLVPSWSQGIILLLIIITTTTTNPFAKLGETILPYSKFPGNSPGIFTTCGHSHYQRAGFTRLMNLKHANPWHSSFWIIGNGPSLMPDSWLSLKFQLLSAPNA